ncbi:MAG: pilus assembly protein [Herminiimonas sp.]|nr:pilus assembly protein [Herminiimonas sp.]
MLEFTVVAPIITLLGLGSIQYGMLFHAKNQYNHAAFMAARAGSIRNANLEQMRDAYARALIPLYGGGTNAGELATALQKARTAVAANTDIVMLNPTKESFLDWNDKDLQKKFHTSIGQHVIPNGGLAFKKAAIVPEASGQSIQDANLLKLRIMHGHKPGVPLIGAMYVRYLQWLDTGADPRASEKINRGLIPVVTQITMQMQSDAIEGSAVSMPGMGNGGAAANPGDPPLVQSAPPSCAGAFCTENPGGSAHGGSGGGDSGGGSAGNDGDPSTGGTGASTQPGGTCGEPGRA